MNSYKWLKKTHLPYSECLSLLLSFLISAFEFLPLKYTLCLKICIGSSGWLLAMQLLSISHVLGIYFCKSLLNEERLIPTWQVVQLLYPTGPIAVPAQRYHIPVHCLYSCGIWENQDAQGCSSVDAGSKCCTPKFPQLDWDSKLDTWKSRHNKLWASPLCGQNSVLLP